MMTACAVNKGFLQPLTLQSKSGDSKAFHVTNKKGRTKKLVKYVSITCHKVSSSSLLKFPDTLQRDHSLRLCLLRYILAAAVNPFLQQRLTDVKSRQAKYVIVYQVLLIPKSISLCSGRYSRNLAVKNISLSFTLYYERLKIKAAPISIFHLNNR